MHLGLDTGEINAEMAQEIELGFSSRKKAPLMSRRESEKAQRLDDKSTTVAIELVDKPFIGESWIDPSIFAAIGSKLGSHAVDHLI